jgi:2',3'-cyclic-nucleotide 2'-phosphodiesterase (5'-nucleotidase family)
LIVNTDGDYKYLDRLVSEFDPRGLLDLDSLNEAINGARATHPDRLGDLGLTTADADKLLEAVEELRGNAVGLTSVFLDGDRNTVRRQESSLGNLTADANLWLARKTDHSVQVSIKNGGGIRASVGQKVFPPGSTQPNDIEFRPPLDGQPTAQWIRKP